jgi:hypothetical protein
MYSSSNVSTAFHLGSGNGHSEDKDLIFNFNEHPQLPQQGPVPITAQ